jgi:large subunit ribosomal protein L17
MRHRKEGKKFHRLKGRRASFLRNITNDLIRAGKITTTDARAVAVRPRVERLITLAKKQTLASRRLIVSRVHNEKVAQKLVEELAPRYKDRQGGYVRIIKTGQSRKRDGSRLATVEFV